MVKEVFSLSELLGLVFGGVCLGVRSGCFQFAVSERQVHITPTHGWAVEMVD